MESPIISLLPILIVFFIFYIFVLAPQYRDAKRRKQMLDALKKGDIVLTSGGIYGQIVDIKGNIVDLKISENTKIKISKEAISTLIEKSQTVLFNSK